MRVCKGYRCVRRIDVHKDWGDVRGYWCVCKVHMCVSTGIVGVFSDPLPSIPLGQPTRQIPTSSLGEVRVLSGYRQD